MNTRNVLRAWLCNSAVAMWLASGVLLATGGCPKKLNQILDPIVAPNSTVETDQNEATDADDFESESASNTPAAPESTAPSVSDEATTSEPVIDATSGAETTATDDPPTTTDDTAPALDAATLESIAATLGNKQFEFGRSSGTSGASITGDFKLELCAFGSFFLTETTIFSGVTFDSFLGADSTRRFAGAWSVIDDAGLPTLELRVQRGLRDGEEPVRHLRISSNADGDVLFDGARATAEDTTVDCETAGATIQRAEALFAEIPTLFGGKRITVEMIEDTDIGTPEFHVADMILCADGRFQAVQVRDRGFSTGPDEIFATGTWQPELDPFAGVIIRLAQETGDGALLHEFYFVSRDEAGVLQFTAFLSPDSSQEAISQQPPVIVDAAGACQ